jgi:vacuolar-type H+-ATPase subunit H
MMSQKANWEGDGAYSILKIINQKEAEIRQQVAEAQHRTAGLIQAAREEAKLMLAQADQEARAEAEQCYQRGVEEANEKAEALLIAARERAMALRHLAQARLDEAAWRLVSLTLPASAGDDDSPALQSSAVGKSDRSVSKITL